MEVKKLKLSALEKALEKSKAKDSKILEKLIDKEKLSYEEKDGLFTITGLDEQIEKIKEEHNYLFNGQDDGQNIDLGGNHGEKPPEDLSHDKELMGI